MSAVWPFGCYKEYLDYQQRRASTSRGLTRRAGAKRKAVTELLRRYAPDAQTVLCLGARDISEVTEFQEAGYDAEGIDVATGEGLSTCDMTDLDGDERFRQRQFDVFVMLHSLGHCWDFERFQQQTLPHCQLLVATLPCRRRPSPWECRVFDFQRPDAEEAAFQRAFPGFSLVHREFADGQLTFLMQRNVNDAPAGARTSMKNLVVANWLPGSKYRKEDLETLLRAQVQNSLEVGWHADDILLVTNFPFEFDNVRAYTAALNRHCPRGSKLYAVRWALQEQLIDGVVWAHDLDCWQNVWFDAPEFTDVAASYYSRPKFNGGSVFWRPQAGDILDEVICRLDRDVAHREEPTLNSIFKQPRFADRVTVLNCTYNVGTSGFPARLQRSERPVRVCHFRPTNRIGWETHVLDRNGLGERSVLPRLERVLRKWYPGLSTGLSAKGQAKREAALTGAKS